MSFDEAYQYLLSLGHETLTIKLGLQNTERLLAALGSPHKSFPSVQIAGTNGKGSTAMLLESICRAAGIRAGLFTSPHLISITERIRIDGKDISENEFARLTEQVKHAAEELLTHGKLQTLPTFFEHVTAIALLAFQEANIELAILETGLGGRLDSTTAAEANIVGITPVAMDHQEYLGHTLAEIAAEKAAIIRRGTTAIIAPQPKEAMDVILRRCNELAVKPLLAGEVEPADFTLSAVTAHYRSRFSKALAGGRMCVTFETPTSEYENVCVGLRGRHQITNATTALALAEVLRTQSFAISDEAVVRGLENARHAGRLELWSEVVPPVLFDGAHNPAAARALRDYLDEFVDQPITMIFGAMRDKALKEMAGILFPAAREVILTELGNPRAATVRDLKTAVPRSFDQTKLHEARSVTDALRIAREATTEESLILITGSLYLVGEVQQSIRESFRGGLRPPSGSSPTLNLPNIMADTPEFIDSKKIFEGRVFDVSVDTVREGDQTYIREIVHHPGSAVILPVFDDDTIALVKQYRHPAVKYLLELPAGTLNDRERPEVGAARELEEELGLVAGRMEKLSEFFISPGFLTEKMWLYLATDLRETQQRLEEDEAIEVVRLSIDRALQMITDNEIEDAKTIIGLLLAGPRLGVSPFAPDYPAV